MSIGPSANSTPSASSTGASGLFKSASIATTGRPCSAISAASCSADSRLVRNPSATAVPSAASCSARALPIPPLPPVTSAVRPASRSPPIGQLLQAGASEEVAGCECGGICAYELDDGCAGCLGRQRHAHTLEVLLLGLAVAERVRPDCRPADVGQRRDPGENRREPDVKIASPCFVVRVAGDESLSCFCAGVAAAERRPGDRGAAADHDHTAPGPEQLEQRLPEPVEAIRTSDCQLIENVSHVCCCNGRMNGTAPATRTTISGS